MGAHPLHSPTTSVTPPQTFVIPTADGAFAATVEGPPHFAFAVAVVFAVACPFGPFVCHPAGICCCSCIFITGTNTGCPILAAVLSPQGGRPQTPASQLPKNLVKPLNYLAL